MKVTIHHNPGAEWQAKRLPYFEAGMRALGYEVESTRSRRRIDSAPAILFGTTSFKEVEATRGDWLLVDRASIGDPEYVSLVWNGHGQRGDHKVPESPTRERWEALGVDLKPMRARGRCEVIAGQLETFTPAYGYIEAWYSKLRGTHFRPHPGGCVELRLPIKKDWEDIKTFHVLSSSIGVEAWIEGVHVKAHDPVSMVHGWEDREAWATWLAWTQWSWDEIAEGGPIRHLFE